MIDDNDYYVEIKPSIKEDRETGEFTEKIILPSDSEPHIDNIYRREKPKKKIKKIWYILTFIVLIYLFYEPILTTIMDVLKSNPTIYKIYLGLEAEIANNTIKGLFYASIFGSLFFLALPSEALFIYFLNSTTYPSIIIILLIVLGNLVGLTFNYAFGRFAGERIVRRLFSSSFDKYQRKIDRFGGYILLLGNIFPGPIEVLSVFYGSFKFEFNRYLYLAFIGRLIKYLILFLIFIFYWDSIIVFYSDVLSELGTLKGIYMSI